MLAVEGMEVAEKGVRSGDSLWDLTRLVQHASLAISIFIVH